MINRAWIGHKIGIDKINVLQNVIGSLKILSTFSLTLAHLSILSENIKVCE
jgi:hypothetical protein